MPKLKVLSGPDLLRIFRGFGFDIISQKGSHIKIRRSLAGTNQNLVIPNHRELDTGTCKAIFRQALRYIPEADLRPHFFTE